MATSTPSRSLEFGALSRVESDFSAMARAVRGSIILGIAAEVRKLQASGKPLCNLTVGDFDSRQFPIPGSLRERIIEAVRAGETNYPPSDGILPLREAVREYVSREHGIEYPLTSVLITAGGRPSIYAIFRCLVDAGDRVLYSVPSWNNDYYAEMVGAEKLSVRASPAQGFQPTLKDLTPHLRQATLLCLCSPGNPTGTAIETGALRDILSAVALENVRRGERGGGQRPLFVLYDLMYGSLIQPGVEQIHPLVLVPEAAPWVVIVDGISKAFAATGLRVGWTLGPPGVIEPMKDFLGHVGAWAPRPEQVATAGFLREPAAIAEFRETINRELGLRLNEIHHRLTELKDHGFPVDSVLPQGAMYVSMRLDLVGRRVGGERVTNNETLRRLLLAGPGLAAVPFQAFGVSEDTGWFRLAVGAVSLDDIHTLWPRLRRFLEGVAD